MSTPPVAAIVVELLKLLVPVLVGLWIIELLALGVWGLSRILKRPLQFLVRPMGVLKRPLRFLGLLPRRRRETDPADLGFGT
jgi:hypothetical protein